MDRQLLQSSTQAADQGSLLCLRCRVSHPMEAKLRALHRQFAAAYGLDLISLASYVLDDDGRPLPYADSAESPGGFVPFGLEVVRTYDTAKGCGLPHWARQKLQAHNGLKAHLREQGLLLIGDWALLADASPTRIRQAWEAFGRGELMADQAVALHRSYLPLYRQAKEDHRSRKGRQGGWLPDGAFFQQVDPSRPAADTYAALKAMADAVRLLKTDAWQRSVSFDQDDTPEPSDPRSLEGDLEEEASDGDPVELRTSIAAALQRAMDKLLPQLVSPQSKDSELLRCLWAGYAGGLGQRPLAERCGCSQGQVSKKLKLQQHATTIATAAALELQRQPAFSAVAGSVEGAERLVDALRNHLLEPEREGDVPPLRRWLSSHLRQP
ncbi:hypothetical protein [Synechococcus sp. EJ6-Ellesmere]|uniref:hypothetical protein n=1 Tax=Synechococcus sp. EJ6-Ellesmere TaxID=2823734 RepID=UPI0020CE9E0F|nr:hypothetical protein [Synechococcus sp. EJ6-Ellesmere]MCP9826286.1 hypothetical protein [Synechococcus sp. EJ6-Ellesmere]